METSAALACFAFVVLAMNFATYFAEDKMTPDEEMKLLCENKVLREAMDPCFDEKVSPLMKEIYSVGFAKAGLKGNFSNKILMDVSCVKGGATTFDKFHDCRRKEVSKRKLTNKMWLEEMTPFWECLAEKATSKPK